MSSRYEASVNPPGTADSSSVHFSSTCVEGIIDTQSDEPTFGTQMSIQSVWSEYTWKVKSLSNQKNVAF